jgi:hypothetical protein
MTYGKHGYNVQYIQINFIAPPISNKAYILIVFGDKGMNGIPGNSNYQMLKLPGKNQA